MAEVIGTISAILGILDTVKTVYGKVSDASHLPEAFQRIISQIDTAWNILDEAEEQYKKAETQELDKIRGTLQICKEDAEHLQTLYTVVCEHADSNWLRRYRRVASNIAHDRSGKVEDLWKHLLETLQVLTSYHIFHNLPTASHSLEEAIKAIEEVGDSLPPDQGTGDHIFHAPVGAVHSGSGANHSMNQVNTGSGTQWQGGTHNHGQQGK
jgi:hypothetical protein